MPRSRAPRHHSRRMASRRRVAPTGTPTAAASMATTESARRRCMPSGGRHALFLAWRDGYPAPLNPACRAAWALHEHRRPPVMPVAQHLADLAEVFLHLPLTTPNVALLRLVAIGAKCTTTSTRRGGSTSRGRPCFIASPSPATFSMPRPQRSIGRSCGSCACVGACACLCVCEESPRSPHLSYHLRVRVWGDDRSCSCACACVRRLSPLTASPLVCVCVCVRVWVPAAPAAF